MGLISSPSSNRVKYLFSYLSWKFPCISFTSGTLAIFVALLTDCTHRLYSAAALVRCKLCSLSKGDLLQPIASLTSVNLLCWCVVAARQHLYGRYDPTVYLPDPCALHMPDPECLQRFYLFCVFYYTWIWNVWVDGLALSELALRKACCGPDPLRRIRHTWIIKCIWNRKLNVFTEDGHEPCHSTDFNLPRLLPLTARTIPIRSLIYRTQERLKAGLSVPGVQHLLKCYRRGGHFSKYIYISYFCAGRLKD